MSWTTAPQIPFPFPVVSSILFQVEWTSKCRSSIKY